MSAQDARRRRVLFDPKPFCDANGSLRALLVHKKTRIELQKIDLGKASPEMLEEHLQHLRCLKDVREFFIAHNVVFEDAYRDDVTPEKAQGRILVTVGGDGTALGASHHAGTSPIFAINSDPTRSVGSLCAADEHSFKQAFDKLTRGELYVQEVTRVSGTLNGHDLKAHALNEILVAHCNPAAMSRYTIECLGEKDEQKSSGLWVATAIGSTGAIMSAGGHIQSLDDDRLHFAVREPYLTINRPNHLFRGTVPFGEMLTITSRMAEGRIFIDGPHVAQPFPTGSILRLHAGGPPLLLFVSDEMDYRRRQIAQLRKLVV